MRPSTLRTTSIWAPVRSRSVRNQFGAGIGGPRAYLPLEIYPISAGVKGGLAGSVAMAVVAMLYGLISQHSIWYPINLLAAGFLPGAMTDTTAKIATFNLSVL